MSMMTCNIQHEPKFQIPSPHPWLNSGKVLEEWWTMDHEPGPEMILQQQPPSYNSPQDRGCSCGDECGHLHNNSLAAALPPGHRCNIFILYIIYKYKYLFYVYICIIYNRPGCIYFCIHTYTMLYTYMYGEDPWNTSHIAHCPLRVASIHYTPTHTHARTRTRVST